MELSTKNVLHPRQITEITEQKAQLQEILSAPPHIRNQLQQGGAAVRKQVQDAEALLRQAPKPFSSEEIDGAVKAEKELRNSWLEGMPTQAEMRRNPPGAVDKNIAWNRAKKNDVLKWKNLRRRLQASEVSGIPENDVSNIEMYRPSSGDMNMDNAQISGKDFHIPSFDNGLPTVFTNEDKSTLEGIDPEVSSQLALLDNEQRAKVKEFLAGINKPPKKKRVWTEEEKVKQAAAMAAGRKRAEERRLAEKQQEE